MAYKNETFDGAVAVSSLEFIPDPHTSAREIRRVLKPNGWLVFVTPGHSPLLDAGLKLMTGKSAKVDYRDGREKLQPALFEVFEVEKKNAFPPLLHHGVPVYSAYRLRPRQA